MNAPSFERPKMFISVIKWHLAFHIDSKRIACDTNSTYVYDANNMDNGNNGGWIVSQSIATSLFQFETDIFIISIYFSFFCYACFVEML